MIVISTSRFCYDVAVDNRGPQQYEVVLMECESQE